MPYRSSLAQAAHDAALKFIDNEIKLDIVTKAMDQLDSEALCEESKNGQSLLHDIFFLPFLRIENKEEASNKAVLLMNLLLKTAYSLGKGKLLFLLTHADSQGFTPLHEALIVGSPASIQNYFAALRQAVQMDGIRKEDYTSLLLNPNKAGFTLLHTALKAENPANMQAYFIALQHVVKIGWIRKKDYASLLLNPNKAGFTPLYEVLKAGNPANTQAYFVTLRQAVQMDWIRKKDYASLLLNPNIAGSPPLYEVLKAGNPANMEAYLTALQQAVTMNCIRKKDYTSSLLLTSHRAGFTPLHDPPKEFLSLLPKTNQESRTLEGIDVSQHKAKTSFNSLPNDLIKYLLPFTFLGAKNAARVLPTVSKRIDALLKDERVYHRLNIHQITKELFQHLVRGEQTQVKATLEKAKETNPAFLLSLLKTQFTITDHAKRQFDKITLFQLALWYLDRHMWEMLLEYLPEAEALAQLQEHELGQAAYVKEHGRHYDFEGPQGLVSAFKNYIQLLDEPFICRNQMDQQWQKGVGEAQGQAPLHVIHEYCRKDVAFSPLTETRFKEKTLPRKINFYHRLTSTSIVSWEKLRSGLGTSFGLYREAGVGQDRRGVYVARAAICTAKRDFAAVDHLLQVRKEEYGFLKKTLIPELDLSQIEKEKKDTEKPDTRLLPMNIPFAQDETDEKFLPALRMISYTTSAPGTLFFGEQKTFPVRLCSQDSAHSVTSSHNRSALSIDEKATTPAFFQLPVPAQIIKNKAEEIGDKFTEAWTKLQPQLPNEQQFRELEELVSQVSFNSSIKKEELIQHVQALQKKIKDITAIKEGGFISGVSSTALMDDGNTIVKNYISGFVIDLYDNLLTLEKLLLKQANIKMSRG